MSIQIEEIQLNVHGQTSTAYLADGGGPGILLLHAWWGLNPFFIDFCRRLAEQGFTVLAPDLRNGQIAKTIEEAKEMMEKSDPRLTGEIVMTAKDYLRNLKQDRKIGAIGFSMGAAWALIAAAAIPDQFGAIVLFYGNEGVAYDKITARVMGHYCEEDEWEPREFVDRTFTEFKQAGVDATRHIYSGVSHWFMEENRPEYNPAAAQTAWERSVEFLKKSL